jgi:hypothetical protein
LYWKSDGNTRKIPVDFLPVQEYHYLALCDKRNAYTIYMERNSKHHAQTKDKTRE